jgi:hypothetical protein
MPQFFPDQVSFGDLPGYGAYDVGHYREHQQFVQTLAMQTPAVLIPDYDFLQFLTAGQARNSIMQTHYQAHLLLRNQIGITNGVDLSAFNLDSQDDFYSWIGFHSQEHGLIRQALGIVG